MIFQVNKINDKLVEKIYDQGMKKFNTFFNLNIDKGKLKIFIVNTRKDIDKLWGEKTESWVVGWSDYNTIYILNRKNYEKESNHKYSYDEYSQLILHEMVHFFHGKLIKRNGGNCAWLNEGLAVYLSGQNKIKKRRPTEFNKFLSFYSIYSSEMYYESGFAVEFLFKKFGKEKLITLIKEITNCNNEKDFYKLFEKIYGFELNYNEINKRYKK